MFRKIELDEAIHGQIFLHRMPGSREPFSQTKATIQELKIGHVVCLTPLVEVEMLAPEYAAAMKSGKTPWQQHHLPIADFGVPSDLPAFQRLIKTTAAAVRHGEHVLIHCRAGIGRTGMFAVGLLLELGLPASEAQAAVTAAGSSPETFKQLQIALNKLESSK